MSGDDTAQLVAAVTMLVLVGTSLLSRRLPLGDTVRMVLGWLLIFAVILLGYSYRRELGLAAQRVTGDLMGERGQVVGETLRIPMAEDGHFWIRGTVNGTSVRFLVDSGATTTALSARTATAAGVRVDEASLPVSIQTANGTVRAQRAQVETLKLGPIMAREMAVVVSPSFGEVNVLGMNFLSSLGSWRVDGRTLVLEPQRKADFT